MADVNKLFYPTAIQEDIKDIKMAEPLEPSPGTSNCIIISKLAIPAPRGLKFENLTRRGNFIEVK